MMQEVAVALVIGMLVEMRVSVGKLHKRVAKAEHRIDSHESRSLPPVLIVFLASCLFMAACSPWRPTVPAIPAMPEVTHATAPASPAGAGTVTPSPAPTPGQRLEHASYLWGGWGIGLACLGFLSAVGLYIWIPALRALWIKQGAAALVLLAAAITVWTFAPGMIYLFWTVSVVSLVSIVCGIAYALKKAHDDDTALIKKA